MCVPPFTIKACNCVISAPVILVEFCDRLCAADNFYSMFYVVSCSYLFLGWLFFLKSVHQCLYNHSRWISSLSPFRSLHNLFCHLSPSLSSFLHPLFHAFFSVQLSLLSLSHSIFPFSVLLRADFPMRCRRGGTRIREGITEKTSPVSKVSLAMLLPNFYNWFF